MDNTPTPILPPRLTLPEALGLLIDRLGCTEDYAQHLLERAIRDRSLRSIVTFDTEGSEIPTDVRAWQEIDWESGIVTIEPSWSGSPPTHVKILPMLSRDEFFQVFKLDAPATQTPERNRGGRPAQHDWDAFWVEVCRRVHEEGLPETQKAFVEGMLDWFAERGTEKIDESTVAKKISKLLAVLNKD